MEILEPVMCLSHKIDPNEVCAHQSAQGLLQSSLVFPLPCPYSVIPQPSLLSLLSGRELWSGRPGVKWGSYLEEVWLVSCQVLLIPTGSTC